MSKPAEDGLAVLPAESSYHPNAQAGAWEPLRLPAFRTFWLASLGSNIGTWINGTASGWVMTDLSPSPVMVSLVQAAGSLPLVLFALGAGALTDIVDRRRYLIATQIWMTLAAAVLAYLAATDRLDAWNLLILTFALGAGAAMAMPALSAVIAELVPANLLPQAISLGAVSINLSRSIGPALGGLLLAQLGAWVAYSLNALSFIGMVAMLWRWKREQDDQALPPERFFQALRAGVRYARLASAFRAVLVRVTAFILFATSIWALLPLFARHELGGSPGTYGLLLTFVGIGAVGAAMLLPRVRAHIGPDGLVFAATITYFLTCIGLALVRNEYVVYAIMMVCGASWLTVLSSLQLAAQISVPTWVRGRALSLYLMIFASAMTLGSFLWGWVATHAGTPAAFMFSGIGMVCAGVAVRAFSLGSHDAPDLSPSRHWPNPHAAEELNSSRGPVLVTIEYQIDLDQREAFLATVQQLGAIRRRDGAFAWGVFEDIASPGRYVELFQHASWLDHLRQHARVTREDQRVQESVYRFHQGQEAPKVSHFVGGIPMPFRDSSIGTGE
jgi:MFS family permease